MFLGFVKLINMVVFVVSVFLSLPFKFLWYIGSQAIMWLDSVLGLLRGNDPKLIRGLLRTQGSTLGIPDHTTHF